MPAIDKPARPRFRTSAPLAALLITLVSAISLQCKTISRPLSEPDRERALTQLRETVARAQGKPSDGELAAFERKYAGTRAAALARLLRGYLHYSAGEFAESAPLFDESIIKEGTGLGDYALYYQASAYRQAGDLAQARRAFSELAERYPQSPFAREGRNGAAGSALRQNDAKGALKILGKSIDDDPGALLIAAQCYEQLNRVEDAIAAYRKLYYEMPQSSESDQAATRLAALGYRAPEAGKEGAQRLQTRFDRLYEAGVYARATETFAQLQTAAPDAATRPRNQLRNGISLYNSGRFREAASLLQAVPASARDEYWEARYYLARSYQRQKLGGQFADIAAQLMNDGAQSKVVGEHGNELLAGLVEHFQNTNTALADRYRTRLIKEYPQSREADLASYQAAWRIHNDKRYAEASEALIAHLANFPNTDMRGTSTFWAGRDAERAGNTARAAALYEGVLLRYRYGYYGFLATKRLEDLKKRNDYHPEQPAPGSVLGRAIATIKPPAPLPETAGTQAEARLDRAENLHIIALDDLALNELEAVRHDAPTSPRINFAIASIYHARGDNLKAVQTLQRAHPDYLLYQGTEAPREVFEIFFPIIEWDTIKTEAARFHLDPYIVAGLIRQESVFDPRVRSHANAYGLMQLLPSTGKLVARKEGSGNITADQLYNPRLNIKLGVAYLAGLVDKYGRIEYAAAAYNGGPGRVDRWLQTLPSEIEDWVEAIPITETRLYVQGVLRNAAHYRRIYGASSAQ